jgi:hypothetical protein
MSLSSEGSLTTFASWRSKATGTLYSYSARGWRLFDAWQRHVRNSAASVGNAVSPYRDRDLRRTIVEG